MSNQKGSHCKELGKITFDITVQSTEDSSDLLQQGSKELEKYLEDLVKNNQRNPKHLCLACWCHLTYFQRQQHSPVHQSFIRTSEKYTEKASFETLAIQFGHFKEINEVRYIFKIKEKPISCMQLKKGKVQKEEPTILKSEVPTSIPLDLSKTSLKKIFFSQSVCINSNEASQPQEKIQKKVRFPF